jgi:hypothetical protein
MANDFPDDERFNCERSGGGPDVIVFDDGLEGTVTLAEPLPPIERTLTIRGRGADRIRIDGDQLVQILTVNPGVAFVLEAITLQNGAAGAGNGGALALLPGSNTTLRDCRITGSSAMNGGGVVADDATLRIERCLIDANTATGEGGGVLNQGGAVALVNTTVSGNSAGQGGGVAALDAVESAGSTSLRSVTLADNTASSGGNVLVAGTSDLEAQHTVFATPAAGENCAGTVTSLDWNLDDDGSCGLGQPHDQGDVTAGLAALAPNGGPTATHALGAGSAAIDAGDAFCRDADGVELQTDQRGAGFPRRTNGDGLSGIQCDVGAFETVPEPGPAAVAAVAVLALSLLVAPRQTRA